MVETKSLPGRIREGQQKLLQRWYYIYTLPEDKRQPYFDGFDNGASKLQELCHTISAMGYKRCLYDDTQKDFCLVCSLQPFTHKKCMCWQADYSKGDWEEL